MKTPIETPPKARDSGFPRTIAFQKKKGAMTRRIPKLRAQNFQPSSPCIQPGSHRRPEAAENPPVTNHTPRVAGGIAKATNPRSLLLEVGWNTKMEASARLRKRKV
jgi:hypothetical protein